MKTKILMTLLLFLSINTFAQFKINQYGRIGIGIEPHPYYKLLIKGGLCLTTYPEIPAPNTTFVEFKFKVDNGKPGAEFGTNIGKIAVWSTEAGFNSLTASHYYIVSDSCIKSNIVPLQNALETVLQLNSYSYQIKQDTVVDSKTTYGFLAQEIQNVLPDIADSAKGILVVDYLQIIPLLTEAMKEQQSEIDSIKSDTTKYRTHSQFSQVIDYTYKFDSLYKVISDLKNQILSCCNLNQTLQLNQNGATVSLLYQNKPNPFKEKTIIEFDIKEIFDNASIMISDMQGTLKKTIAITQIGKGQIMIDGYELTAGMYLYSLIINDKEIDTKRMILLN